MKLGVTNFAITQVATLYTAANTVIALAAGEGSKLPTPAADGPFPLTWWNDTGFADNPTSDPNREVVWVGSRSGDTIVVSRGAESDLAGGAASTKNTSGATYKLLLAPTARVLQQVRDRVVDEIAVTSAVAGFYATGSFAIGWRVQSGQDGVTLTQSTLAVGEVFLPASGSGTEVANGLWRQSIPKAWVTVDTSGQIVVRDSFNINAVTSLVAGLYSVSFSRAFANAFYAITATAADAVTNPFINVDPRSKLAGSCTLAVRTDAGAASATAQVMAVFYGVQ